MGFAVAGGIFLCLGNLGTQYALAYTNLSLTEVVSSSLTVVGGTVLNYFLDDRWEHPTILTSCLFPAWSLTCLSKGFNAACTGSTTQTCCFLVWRAS